MATKKKQRQGQITKIRGNQADVPAYLAEYENEGMERVEQHVVVPMIKIVQGQSRKELKDKFTEGTAVFRPGDVVVCELDQVVHVVPVFFFEEYCRWSDFKDQGERTIMERTFDRTSEIAKRALDPGRRTEEYRGSGDKKFVSRYAEHLNFVCFVYDAQHPLHGEPFVLSFNKGEHFSGRNFSSFLKMRPGPLWSKVCALHVEGHSDGTNDWFGWGFDNPSDESGVPANIAQEHVEFFREAYRKFKDLYEKRMVTVDYRTEDENVDPDVADSAY